MGWVELASISSLYERTIHDTGREPEFIFLAAFLLTFSFIRTSAHMINAGVSWWPGNVEVGGTHIHHLVWGILIVVITGYLMGVAGIREQPAYYIVVALFGFGCGLTFDEFALWLNLRDVYWEKEGRRSIDAVIVVALLGLLGITGFGGWVESADNITNGAFAAVGIVGAIALALAIVTAMKGRILLAAFAVVFWPVGIVGATRFAKPGSDLDSLVRDRHQAQAGDLTGAEPRLIFHREWQGEGKWQSSWGRWPSSWPQAPRSRMRLPRRRARSIQRCSTSRRCSRCSTTRRTTRRRT